MVSRIIVEQFLERHGWSGATKFPLTSDASSRRYIRLIKGSETALLAQSPADGTAAKFISIAEILRKLDLSAPRIFASETNQGLVLQEDFGDETFAALLNSGVRGAPLYQLATETLIHLHQQFSFSENLKIFDTQRFLEEAMLFCDYGPGKTDKSVKRSWFKEAWLEPISKALEIPQSILLRDFHAGNLFRLTDRPGTKACGLIDFQDAGIGPITYDLLSLLQDARWSVPSEIVADCLDSYAKAFPNMDRKTFEVSYTVMAAHRHVRVIAVFHRLAEQGKPGYLAHLPRVWRLLIEVLGHPVLEGVATWFEENLAPTVGNNWRVNN